MHIDFPGISVLNSLQFQAKNFSMFLYIKILFVYFYVLSFYVLIYNILKKKNAFIYVMNFTNNVI